MKMDKIINNIIYILIILLIIYMFYIVYKCKKSDNQILVEKYYNFHNNKYENFIDYNLEKYTQKENECIKNWMNNSEGMKTYLESLNDATRDVIISAITNTECKKEEITLSAPQLAPTTSTNDDEDVYENEEENDEDVYENEEEYDEDYTEDVYENEEEYDEDVDEDYTEDVYENEEEYDEDYTEDVYENEEEYDEDVDEDEVL